VADGGLGLRQMAARLLRKHGWLPSAATLASGLALTILVITHAGVLPELGCAAALLFTSYVWGYSTRAFRHILWPPLSHLQRRQYAEVWNSLSASPERAAAAAAGTEEGWQRSTLTRAQDLVELASISMHDEVLEVGCGVGRIGRELAPRCRSWTGSDISTNMLAAASERLDRLNNVRLVHLSGAGLREFPDDSFDVVYAANMFAHLDEIDRWQYVEEAFRVLRPGGRIYVDNVDLESHEGWTMFVDHARRSQALERPPYDTRFSTRAELMIYVTRAGFGRAQSHDRPPLVIVTATKSSLDPETKGSSGAGPPVDKQR
jgi:ubiquinone/menaquinone biosynthesis C-methylase UbiE